MLGFSTPHGRGLLAIGALLIALSAAMTMLSDLFSYDYYVMVMPIRGLILGLLAAGITYLVAAAVLLDAMARRDPLGSRGDAQPGITDMLGWIFVVGLICRCVLLVSEPALEDDYQRYLWDGAVTASGLNPFAVSPEAAMASKPPSIYAALAAQSGVVLERVNHPELRTIYPPVAQAGFAVAYWLAPFSLYAWKVVCLAGDVATFWLLIALLKAVAKPASLVLLYWWNPVVLKELFNSGHMEALLVPLVLGALLAAVHHRQLVGTVLLTLAAGVKVWPVLLLPLVWVGLIRKPVRLVGAMALTGGLLGLMALPIVLAGLNDDSGFVAYAKEWQTNSALFPALAAAATTIFGKTISLTIAGWDLDLASNAVVRAAMAGTAGLIALAMAIWFWRWQSSDLDHGRQRGVAPMDPAGEARALCFAAAVTVVMIWLLSPAQFPWYAVWALMFTPLVPSYGLLAAAVTLPLYYAAFHLSWQDRGDEFRGVIVWVIWLPIWFGLLIDLVSTALRSNHATSSVRLATN